MLGTPTSAMRIDVYASVATGYVYRGVALRDRATPSLAISTSLPAGWFVDVWSAPVDVNVDGEYDGELHRTFSVDAAAGYGSTLGAAWQWSLAAARIIDVAGGSDNPDAYTEWRANLFFRDRVQAQVAYATDYQQRGWSAWNLEFSGTHPLTATLSGEWGLGRSHGAGRPDGDYSYGWIGVEAWWLQTQWNARWIGAGHGARYVLDDDDAGGRFVLSLSWGAHLTL
jgi:hypothetical protein